MSNPTTPTSQEHTVLRRLAQAEVDRCSALREERAAELREQIAEVDAELDAIRAEYKPQIAELSAEQRRLRAEATATAGRRDAVKMELQARESEVRSRVSEVRQELRHLEGRIIPAGALYETDRQREARERRTQKANAPALRPDARP